MLIYIRVSQTLETGFHRNAIRQRAKELQIHLPHRFPRIENLDPRLKEVIFQKFNEDLILAKKQVRIHLVSLNGIILVISAFASYYLAGKTLKPIEKVMNEQKRFAADASHELRTPLTAMKTSIEVALRDKKMSVKDARKILLSNLEDIKMLEFLSNSLLNLTHLQDNGRNLKKEKVNIAEITEKAYKKILPLAKKNKLNIKCFIFSSIMP